MSAGPVELQATAARGRIPSDRERALGVVDHGSDLFTSPAAHARPRPVRDYLRLCASSLTFSWARETRSPLRPFLTIAIVSALAGLATGGLPVLLVDIQRDLGIKTAVILAAIGVAAQLGALAGPVIGYLGDRVNRLRLEAGFGVLGGSVTAMTGAVSGVGGLIGTRALSTAALGDVGALSPMKLSLLSDLYGATARGRVLAAAGVLDQLANIIGPALAGVLAVTVGWRVGFVVEGIAIALAALALLTIREPRRGEADLRSAGIALGDIPAPRSMSLGETLRTVSSVRTIRRMWCATPFLTFGGGGIFILNYYILVNQRHVNSSTFSSLATVGACIGLLGTIAGGAVVDRFASRNPGRAVIIVAACTTVSGLGIVFETFVPVLPLVFLVGSVTLFFGSFQGPINAAILARTVPPHVRSFAFSTLGLFGVFTPIVPLIVIGYADRNGLTSALIFLIPAFLAGTGFMFAASRSAEADIRAAEAAALAATAVREARLGGIEKLLVCRDLQVEYDGVKVLFGVDLDVEEGEIVALLGTNGAGKSTVLRAISGLSEASGGAVFFDGSDVTHLPTTELTRRGIVQVLGGRAIFPQLSVAENLRVAATTQASDPAFIREQTERILDVWFPALRRRLHERAGSLSGGEQQMLALGQCFLMRPRLLMIDELSLGLSPAVVAQLLDILREIHAGGTTVILVEQSVSVALTVAQRAVFLEKGRVRFEGPTADLLERPDVMRSVFFAGAAGSGVTVADGAPGRRNDDRTATVALTVEDAHVSFGGVQALRGAGLEVRAGEIVGIIGANGAGKTTLFDAISGIVRVQSGSIHIAGRDATALTAPQRARLGLARSFQDARLFPSLTVGETIAVAMERRGAMRSAALAAMWLPPVRRSEARLRRRADGLIELLGLTRYADRFVGELSTGTRRIVDLACMLAADPEVLLLDEPSSGIAQAEVQELAPLLSRVRAETGCAMLVIEHDIGLVASISDRLVAMELGAVLVEGPPSLVLGDARVVAGYLGTARETIERSAAVSVA